MNTAEKIFEEVRTLPEHEAREILDLIEFLKGKWELDLEARRANALATLNKFKERYDGMKFNRDELHDRTGLH